MWKIVRLVAAILLFIQLGWAQNQNVTVSYGIQIGVPGPLTLSSPTMSFGNQTQNTTSSPITITATNGGPGSVQLNALATNISGTNGTDFAVTGATTCTARLVLQINATCNLVVTFTPGTGAVESATLTLTSSAANSPISIPLTGTGISATGSTCGGSGQLPCALGWFQVPSTSIRSLCPSYAEIQGSTHCESVMSTWSGGLFDTTRNRFVIHGGGHHDYYGNEIYAIDLNANPITKTLVKDSTHNPNMNGVPPACPESYSDSTPSSRHSYSSLTYLPTQDRYFAYSGSKSDCGFFSNSVWLFNPNDTTWTLTGASGPNPGSSGGQPYVAYDSVTDAVYMLENNALAFWRYNSAAQTWTNINNSIASVCQSTAMTATIDSVRRLYFCIGGGAFSKVSLNSPFTGTNLTGTGCSALVSTNAPGFTFDPVMNRVIGWAGGNTAYIYNPDTDSCTTQTFSGGPTTIQPNGTYGRFQYSPIFGVFIVANDIDSNAYTLRLDNPPNSFPNRIAGINVAGGVASIVGNTGFESALPSCGSIPCFTGTGQQSNIHYNTNGTPVLDSTIKADGASSLKFIVRAGSTTSDAGYLDWNFKPDFTGLFGAGQEFFLQYRQRIGAALLGGGAITNDDGIKHDITTEGDSATDYAGDCSNHPGEVVTQTDPTSIFKGPWMYINCGYAGGGPHFQSSGYEPVQLPGVAGSNFLDQDATGCPHYNTGIPATDPTCWLYVGDEWFTIQKHIKIGAFGTASSVIEQWFAHQSQPARLTTNASDAAIPNNASCSPVPCANSDSTTLVSGKYGKLSIGVYGTGVTFNVNTQVNFDSIIVSTRRIPDPDVTTPNAPDSLSLSVATGHITVNWRVNSANGTAQDDTGFLVERCTGTPQTCFPNPQVGFTQIGTAAAGASTFQDNTTVAAATYTYRVRAKNATGNSAYTVAVCFNGGATCGGTAVAQ